MGLTHLQIIEDQIDTALENYDLQVKARNVEGIEQAVKTIEFLIAQLPCNQVNVSSSELN